MMMRRQMIWEICFFLRLIELGSVNGYFPEESKIMLIIRGKDTEKKLNDDEGWGILPIDARNAFNEGNTKMMSWVARHEW